MLVEGAVATAFLVLAAVVLDRIAGEPPRWHPLVGFGRLAAARAEAALFNAILCATSAFTCCL